MNVRAVGTLMFAALVVSVPSRSQAQTTLSLADVQAAIDWGISHDDIRPYLLHHAEAEGTNAVIVGAVYTPFVRIALMSRRALLEGRRLEPSELPAHLAESRFDIAARWYPKVGGCTLYDQTNVLAAHRGIGVAAARRRDGVLPSAVRDASWLPLFAPEPPYSDIAVVVSYPMSMLREDVDFLVWRDGASDKGLPCRSVEIGRIPSAERNHWR
jgi:hypothetical protein